MYFENKGVRIEYNVEGEGEKTLLFIHGAFINKEYWNNQKDHFSGRYRVVTIDLPGHGGSGKERSYWSLEAFGDDVCALIAHLKLDNVVLIGHSMGGSVMLEAACKCPQGIIQLIGVDNFKNAAEPLPDKIQKQVDVVSFMLKIDFKGTCETFVRKALMTEQTDREIVERVVEDFRSMDKDPGIDIILAGFNSWERERELMAKLPLKLFLINVNYIPTNEDLLKKHVKNGYELIGIQGSSHYPMIEVPEAFNTAIESVISR